MEGGLRATSTSGQMGGESAPPERLTTMTQSAAGSPATGGQTTTATGFESHLDSFFAQSGWTRDDLVTAATVLNTVLFLTLVYMEVSK